MVGDMLYWMICCGALIALAQDLPSLDQAADPKLPEAQRHAAFSKLLREAASDPTLLITASQQGDDTRRRWVAIRAMGQLGGVSVQDPLRQLMADPEPAIRTAAAAALGDLGDRTMSPALIQALNDPAVIVRAAAAEALGKLQDPRAVAPLGAALFDPDNYYRGSSLWVRRHYIDSMATIGNRQALPFLLRALDDGDEAVAQASVRALEQIVGISFASGRTPEQERESWRRWADTQRR